MTEAERKQVSSRLYAVAEQHVIGEMICCEPLDPSHSLCARGYDILAMVRWLLVGEDPAKAWNPQPVLLDAVFAEMSRVADERARAEAEKLRALADEVSNTTRTGRILRGALYRAADEVDPGSGGKKER